MPDDRASPRPYTDKCHSKRSKHAFTNVGIEKSLLPAILFTDAGIIAAAQKAEHYEIASYGALRTYADMTGYKEAGQIIQQILDEEGQVDKHLTQIAEKNANIRAEDMGSSKLRAVNS